tara:strand:+ start:242 stop:682 length:441 start_codon:yes stop_codon:yes gene_type:complete
MSNTPHSPHCRCVCCCWQRGLEWQRTADANRFKYLVLVTSFFEAKRAAGGAHWSYDPDSIFALIDFWFAELEREGTLNAWASKPDLHEMMRWANRFIGDAPGLSEELLSWRVGGAPLSDFAASVGAGSTFQLHSVIASQLVASGGY